MHLAQKKMITTTTIATPRPKITKIHICCELISGAAVVVEAVGII